VPYARKKLYERDENSNTAVFTAYLKKSKREKRIRRNAMRKKKTQNDHNLE